MVKHCLILSPEWILFIFTFINLLVFMDRGALSAIIPILKSHSNGGLGLSSLEAGSLGSVFILGFMLASPIFAHLSQKHHPMYLILIGNIIWAISVLFTGLSRNFFTLLAARSITGIGEASFVCLAPPLILDSADPNNKTKWIGIFYSSSALGYAIGFIYGAQISSLFGAWYYPFLLEPFFMIPLIVISLISYKDPKLHVKKDDVEDIHQQIWIIVKIPIFMFLSFGYSAYSFCVGGLAFWGPDFVQGYYGLDSMSAAYSLGIVTIFCAIVGTYVGSHMLDKVFSEYDLLETEKKISRSRLEYLKLEKSCKVLPVYLFAGMSLVVLFLFISTLSGFPGNVVIFLIGLAAGEFLIFITTSPLGIATMNCVPMHLRGQSNAVSIFIMHSLGDFPSPAIIGAWFDTLGMFWGMVLTCLWLIIGVICWAVSWNISRFHQMPFRYALKNFFKRVEIPDTDLVESLSIN